MILETEMVSKRQPTSGPAEYFGLKPLVRFRARDLGRMAGLSAFDHGISRGRFGINAKVVQSVVSASQQRCFNSASNQDDAA